MEKIREELRQHLEQFEKVNLENNSLLRSKTELTMKLETVENEVSELNELILVLREEKAHLEKALVDAQKSKAAIQEEKNDLLRQLGSETSSISNLQGKYVYLKKKNVRSYSILVCFDAFKKKILLGIHKYFFVLFCFKISNLFGKLLL